MIANYLKFYADTILRFINIPISIGGLTFTFYDVLLITILCSILGYVIKEVF